MHVCVIELYCKVYVTDVHLNCFANEICQKSTKSTVQFVHCEIDAGKPEASLIRMHRRLWQNQSCTVDVTLERDLGIEGYYEEQLGGNTAPC